MSYIFRLNTVLQNGQGTLPSAIKDWNDTNAMGYTPTEIAQIPPSNPTSTNEPTSIPSPFARLALTKTAFKEVAEKGTNALRAYQQIVSNSLDVAEIFFNFSTLKDHAGLEIIKWSYGADLKNIQSGILKSTLELFFNGDAQSLNLSKTTTFYFIRHCNTGKIIGGTSPRTLFFSAANVKRRRGGVVEPEFIYPDGEFFVKNEITNDEAPYGKIELGNNHFAFSDIKPLSERNMRFQDYLHTWVKVNDNITVGHAFPEVSAYLQSQIAATQTAHFNALPANLNAYEQIKFGETIYPEILDKGLKEQKINPSDIADTSDFVVFSTISEDAPLILGGTAPCIENWQLDSVTKWGTHTVNPTQDRSILPNGTRYTWLTAEDFLENEIIQLPKPVEKGYFSGNHTNNGNKSVLLPLKDKFFEFFTTEELQSMLKIDGSAAIKVTLEIPVKDSKKVTFTKEYKNADVITLSGETDFMLFPNVKFSDMQSAFYRFGLFREFTEIKKMSAKFYNRSNEVTLNENNEVITRNDNDHQNHICTTYALEQKEFDRIKILIDGNKSGIIIPDPKKEKEKGPVNFTFAVDFGTTNTHIEYKTSEDGRIKPFDITDKDGQISWFVNPGDRVCQTRLVADIDFIPEHIGYVNAKNIKVKFPARTALIVANNATTDHKLPFAHTNIVLPFDKRNVPVYNGVPITQLKWESNIEEAGYYINNLCYLMRNKVVLRNGELANTKILWTYPLSMNSTRLEQVTEIWEKAYKKYFGSNFADNCKNLTESLAPFYHYSSLPDYREYIKDLVSIDIGGGTTDVVFVKDSQPNFVTSFRFAANDLLGLGQYTGKIIAKHKQDIENQISEFLNLSKTMCSIEQNTDFGDFASFFFSLKDNEDLTEKGKSIDFNKTLKEDNNQKLVFLLFFAAIIYHTAQVMKAKRQSLPRHLTFSGNGSRIIDVLGKKDMLEKIATLIFEKIFDAKYGTDGQPQKLEIIPNTGNPKEVTCKGTINTWGEKLAKVSYDVLLGTDDTTFADNQTYSDLQEQNADLIDNINSQVEAFFTYVFDELLKSEIRKQVGAESVEKALSIPQTAIDKAKEVVANKEDMVVTTPAKIKFV